VDVEAGVRPRENALRPFGAEEFPANKKRQHLAAEDLGQARIIKEAHLMEGAHRIHPALGHQKMQVRMKIDPVPEGLDYGDNAGLKCFARCSLKIYEKCPDRAAAKIAQEPAFELEKYPEHLGDREDHLAVGYVQKKCLLRSI